jgi:flavin-dependent dehydrogenase
VNTPRLDAFVIGAGVSGLTSAICLAEAGTDAAALMIGVDFDTGEVDLGGAVFDVEHADACPAGGLA